MEWCVGGAVVVEQSRIVSRTFVRLTCVFRCYRTGALPQGSGHDVGVGVHYTVGEFQKEGPHQLQHRMLALGFAGARPAPAHDADGSNTIGKWHSHAKCARQ